jgi:hypothetical protein
MNVSREYIVAIIGLAPMLIVGGWAAIDPPGWIRYFLKSKPEISPEDPGNRSVVRFVGICLAILAAFCLVATFKPR